MNHILEIEADTFERVRTIAERFPFPVKVHATSTNNLYQLVVGSVEEVGKMRVRIHRFYKDVYLRRDYKEDETVEIQKSPSSTGQKLGSLYRTKDRQYDAFFCKECERMYLGDYPSLDFVRDLWSIDQWAQRRICHHCKLTLLESFDRAKEDIQADQQKPGPKSRYGGRKQIALWLPLDLVDALDKVAQPEPGYTAFIIESIRMHPKIAAYMRVAYGVTKP